MKIGMTRKRLWATTLFVGVTMGGLAETAHAQSDDEAIVVTGSRIARQDYVANSPITTVTEEAITGNADVTLDTFLNTLPQVSPASTTSSNNPGNDGQANIDLRGLGPNRNLVLVDGRRPQPSADDLTVDLNTIPQALIESIEVITGGAGSAYGADAIAGAVNIKLKDDFEGLDVSGTYSNSTEFWDAKEYQISGVFGGNFADGKGNAVIAIDRAYREPLIKSQRDFAKFATSTTTFQPEGTLRWSNTNAPTQAAFDTVFGTYGVAPGSIDAATASGRVGFNLDGTLFYGGIFNSPFDVQNYRGPIDDSVNTALFPDLYSYNFDAVNLLVLPLDRDGFMGKLNYEFDNKIEIFSQIGWTEYNSSTALAPTPISTVNGAAPGEAEFDVYQSPLIESGQGVTAQLVIPTTNPFIPADLAAVLASRTGDDPALVGSGATEPFYLRQRTLDLGLRQSDYENTVVSALFGARGPIGATGWDWEVSFMEGRTEIDETQTGNVDTQRLQGLLEAPDGGASICDGGFNPFGRQPISADCASYLQVNALLTTELTQRVFQGFMRGDVIELPAGPLQAVIGAEYREFEYDFDPGAVAGPISGFTSQTRDLGENNFTDFFGEALIPIASDAPFARTLEVNLGYRFTQYEFVNKSPDFTGDRSPDQQQDHAYKIEANWEPVDYLRVRGSYNRAIRAPNFAELFAGGGSAPQYFDPCSADTVAVQNPDVATLCANAGLLGGVSGVGTFVQTPGGQLSIDLRGNTNLEPETADTYTVGLVFNAPWENRWAERFRASIDYYNIKISDAILQSDPNLIMASCYNYFGNNPTYDPAFANCAGILRLGTDALAVLDLVNDPVDGFYQYNNDGEQNVSGVDLQVDWGFDLEWVGAPSNWGSMTFNVLLSHLLEFEQRDTPGAPAIDYAGTVGYFGAASSSSVTGVTFPEWKANLTGMWEVGPFSFLGRGRYIGEMDNRASRQFPGESFEGVDSTWYWDFVAGWQVTENAEVRLGLNNAFDEDPQIYAPNVQSGTDPGTYDVIGRRFFAQVNMKF